MNKEEVVFSIDVLSRIKQVAHVEVTGASENTFDVVLGGNKFQLIINEFFALIITDSVSILFDEIDKVDFDDGNKSSVLFLSFHGHRVGSVSSKVG